LVGPTDTLDLSGVGFRVAKQSEVGAEKLITYVGQVRGRTISVEYHLSKSDYVLRVSGSVSAAGNHATTPFLVISLPGTFASYEADSLDDQRHLAFAVKPRRSGAQSIPFAKLDPGEHRLVPGPIAWAAVKSKYFIVGVLAPANDSTASFAEFSATGGARTGRMASHAAGSLIAPLQDGRFSFEMYVGPQQWERLLALGRDFENSNPYGGFLQPVVQPFATIVMRILLWMHRVLRLSYGWVLIVFGVTVRLVLWPLNQNAMRTSIKMQRIQPEITEVQKRYKNDPQRLQSEMMRVYREHGMSPFSSLSGCLPMLLPMPVLFALFFVFQNTIEFRGVPFLWLQDISLKDPYYVIPLFMGVSMYALSWIGMRSSPPNPQAKIMSYMLPVMMTLLFLNFASGLNLYYAVQNLAALPQQWLLAHERAKSAPQKPSANVRA
jgi:YidC/Oxa1 family membrane protein insertase